MKKRPFSRTKYKIAPQVVKQHRLLGQAKFSLNKAQVHQVNHLDFSPVVRLFPSLSFFSQAFTYHKG